MSLYRPRAAGLLALAAAVIVTLFVAGVPEHPFGVAAGEKRKASGPPPLVVNKAAPLLLEAPAKAPKPSAKSAGPAALNQTCFVCHDNYAEEPLVDWHAKADIGCVKCHGESQAHCNDENNITPPQIMYPAGKIDGACSECHETHNVPAKQVIARLLERCPEKIDPTKIVCTNCHGQHRLKARSVSWHKETGKLLGQKKDSASRQ